MCIHTSTPLLAAPVDALDFFIPKSTRYHDINGPVKHKQSWSTWRGLSSAHAEDLAVCELEFRRAIQARVEAYVDGFFDYSTKQESIFTVKVNIHELAVEIAEVYYATSQLASPLLGLQGLVQFIRLHDCFVRPTATLSDDQPLRARIRVKTSLKSSTPVIFPYAPRLVFDDLVVQIQQGQNYYLKPRYSPVYTSSKNTEVDPQVAYTTTCEWLRYNKERGYFAGTVPRSNGATQKIDVKATVVYRFPNTDISHEETIQAAVKILPIAPSAEFEYPAYVKHVRFASGEHDFKTPEVHQLKSRNSFSVLENCSNMDQDRQRMATPLMPGDFRDSPWTPIIESGEIAASPSHLPFVKPAILAATKSAPQPSDKKVRACKPYLGPRNIHAGVEGFYSPIGNATGEPEDDGIATKAGENVRKACQVDFAPGEDPRDVRQMKKELLQMELDSLSKSMLGFRIDRWSDDQDISDDSELETTGRQSIGY